MNVAGMSKNGRRGCRIVLAIVLAGASASVGLRGQSLPALAEASSSATAWTPDFMSNMQKLMSRHGSDRATPAPFANALGLAPAGKMWANRQVVAQGHPTSFLHSFAVSRGDDPDLLLSVRRTDVLLAFRVHRDGTLVSAVSFNLQTKQITILDLKASQPLFADECAFWTHSVDELQKN